MSLRKVPFNRLQARRFFRTFNRTVCSNSVIHNNILSSGVPDVKIPNVSITEHIFANLARYEKYTALECGITGRKYTYLELRKKTENLCKSLRKKFKLNEGDVVAILLPNIPEFPIAILGIVEARLVATTINPIYTPHEISRQLLDSNSKLIITLVELHETVKSSITLSKKNIPVVTIKTQSGQSLPENTIDFFELTDQKVDFPHISSATPECLAFLPYSSGTTGLPKGVELTHFNSVANLVQNDSPDIKLLENATDNHQEVIPAVLPFFHIYGLELLALYMLTTGSKTVTLPRFTPDSYISVLKNNKTTGLLIVPPIVLFLTAHNDVKKDYLRSVKFVMSGAAPLGAMDEARFAEKFGAHIGVYQGYGLTETSPTVAMATKKLKEQFKEKVCGSIGRVLPNTLAKVINIDDPNFTALPPNTSGELLVKGPQVMRGYHNRPEETKNTIVEDGWLRTGDMVHYNEDGIIYVTDRLKELIKVKGFQVPPAELEEIVRSYPGVTDAAVIGIEDELHGQLPRAYVVVDRNQKINVEDIKNYVAEKVAPYKQLKGGVALVDSIPKNPSGKILRRVLKEQFEKGSK